MWRCGWPYYQHSPAFEAQDSRDALVRVENLLDGDLRALEIINVEYSSWNETVDYIANRNLEFQEDNLSPGYWRSIDVSLVMVFDADGEQVYGWVVHPVDGHTIALDKELLEPLLPDHILVRHESLDSKILGLLRTRSGLMQIASYPVTNTSGTGPLAGTLILGQFLSESRLLEMAVRATADVSLHVLGEDHLPAHVVTALSDMTEADATVATHSDSVHGLQVLRDVNEKPVAVLEISQPRNDFPDRHRYDPHDDDISRRGQYCLLVGSTIFYSPTYCHADSKAHKSTVTHAEHRQPRLRIRCSSVR